jgi:hypothetical protein
VNEFIPDWFEDTEARDKIIALFGVIPGACILKEVILPAWRVTYELAPGSGVYNEVELELVDLGYEAGYWVMGYAKDITTLFYRRYRG